MRLLTAVLFAAFAVPVTLAQDKGKDKDKETDADKAKAAAVAFMKAVKAKDVDAVLKTVDVPFLLVGAPQETKIFEKAADLKADLKPKFEGIKDTDKIPTEVAEVHDLPAIRKELGQKADKVDAELLKHIEKVVGDKGYMVRIGGKGDSKKTWVLVRIKDGKAAVVGSPG